MHLLTDFKELRQAYGISERGMQVLELTLEGFSIAQIAQNLGITERTVKYHTAQNFQKTNTGTYKQLFSWSSRNCAKKSGRMPAIPDIDGSDGLYYDG